MVQRDLAKIAIGAVGGAVVVAVVALLVTGGLGRGSTDTKVTLWQMPDGSCAMGKETQVHVEQDKHVTWKIENYCTSQAVVAIGNFRKQQQGGGSDCSGAGSSYPFVGSQPRSETLPPAQVNGDIEPSKGEIKLKAKRLDNENPELYYFDICLNGVSVDPMLVVER